MLPPPGPHFPDRGLSPPIVLRLELSFPGSQHLGGLPWREYGDVPPPPPVLVEDDSGEVVMRITKPVHQEILDALTSRRPEAGGILLGPRNHHAVTHFILDENAATTPSSFTLDHVGLNRILKRYRTCEMDMKGIVHSHPRGLNRPSKPDLEYVLKTFSNPKNSDVREFLLPIVCGEEFFPFVVTRGEAPGSEDVVPAKLVLF